MENENKLIYVDDEGSEVLCEILFTFDSEEFKKSYVLFYPVGQENEEEVEILAASYAPMDDGTVGELFDIETDEEWDLIQDTLDAFNEDDEECEECDCDEEGCEDDDCCKGHHHK